MAHDAMAREFGPIEAVPPPPPQVFSRYRSLRGKSVSSPREFDIWREQRRREGESVSEDPGQSSSGSPRSRSKSVNSCHPAMRPKEVPPEVPAVPAVPAMPVMTVKPLKVLSPKPINVAAQSSLKILENLKSPMFSHPNPSWKSLGSINRSANQNNKQCGVPQPHGDQHESGSHNGDRQPTNTPDPDASETVRDAGIETCSDAVEETEIEREEQQQQQLQPHPPPPPPPEPSQEREQGPDLEQQQSERQRRINSEGLGEQLADEIARLEAETDRILAEQKKLDLARLQAQLVTPPPKPKRQILEKLSFFSRSKRTTATSNSSQPSTPSTTVSAIFSPALSHYSRDSSLEDPPTSPGLVVTKMNFIEAGGKGIVPQTDAPLSASNGGERRVIVRCFTSTINLPVTIDTSPIDILTAAAGMTRHHLTPATCVIIECYFVLGLERRLRRYERIRDVMNSWDRDQQNSLLIMSSDSSNGHPDLELESIPCSEAPPTGFSIQMFHSAKPGKWNKRWVTLLENGQIYAAKSAGAQPSDKESTVLCHLTDFDIYCPKESEMRRNLKPPKRFCYAIKSQQKTVVFPNGENFVHFFSTEDEQQATCFHDKVHGWRSWYLVNRMVDLERKSKPPRLVLDAESSTSNLKNGPQDSKSKESSSGAAPEVAVEPLMNVDQFRVSKIVLEDAKAKKSATSGYKAADGGSNSAKRPFAPPALEMPRTVMESETEFSAGGLLGDAYNEKRRQAEVLSSKAAAGGNGQTLEGPFTGAPSLLNGGLAKSSSDSSDMSNDAEQGEKGTEAKSWFPSAAEHSARIRNQSMQAQQRRPMTADAGSSTGAARRERHPAPLLSFPKDFPEPPRFQNGPNPGVRSAHGQPLINFATGGAARDATRDGAVRRNASRRGAPPPPSGGPPAGAPPVPPPPPPGSQRMRSKSTASQRRFNPNDAQHHPMPPLPVRRPTFGEQPFRLPSKGMPEPLVSRAR